MSKKQANSRFARLSMQSAVFEISTLCEGPRLSLMVVQLDHSIQRVCFVEIRMKSSELSVKHL